jgi:hypothetical protein
MNMSIFIIWHFHNRTERRKEKPWQESEKQQHIVHGFFYVVANAFLHVLPVLCIQTNRKDSLS